MDFVLQDDSKCFACGLDNPDGLCLPWHVEGNTMTTLFTPAAKYQSWKGIVHGGILATVLDESMTRLACMLFGSAVTAEMTVRYLLPAYVGETLFVKGMLIHDSRKIVDMQAVIHKKDLSGPLIAKATGKIIKTTIVRSQ